MFYPSTYHTLQLDDYQLTAHNTAAYPVEHGLTYTALGLAGEAGEVANKIKKCIRDGTDVEVVRSALIDELGDVLWYVATLAGELNANLSEVAGRNIEKLEGRARRGTISGEGDDR